MGTFLKLLVTWRGLRRNRDASRPGNRGHGFADRLTAPAVLHRILENQECPHISPLYLPLLPLGRVG